MVPRKTSLLMFVQLVLVFSVSKAAWPDYYTVHDNFQPQIQAATLGPVETLSEVVQAATPRGTVLDLLNWDHHQEILQDPSTPYNRKAHYGSWVRDPRDKTCYNTRAKVLIRGSSVPVDFSNINGCTVKNGRWFDPYSNRQYSDASDIQIDHVVPLKNSYISGAWSWDAKKRCLYANFLANDFHLLAVSGSENMRKGDRTPAEFMPSNQAFACEYLADWLKIKLIWNLALTPSESSAISRLTKENNCDAGLLSMAVKDLSQQRQAIIANMDLCSGRK